MDIYKKQMRKEENMFKLKVYFFKGDRKKIFCYLSKILCRFVKTHVELILLLYYAFKNP